jgi:hypothetical protein
MSDIPMSLSAEQIDSVNRLGRIFSPSKWRLIEEKYGDIFSRMAVAHYTSAESAMSILRTKTIWMRSAFRMVDYSETRHGYELLVKLLGPTGTLRGEFCEVLKACGLDSGAEIIDGAIEKLHPDCNATYIASFSEHHSNEDNHGRLSMWRGFGGSAPRVAFIVGIPFYTGTALRLGVQFMRVSYHDIDGMEAELRAVLTNIRNNVDFLKGLTPPVLRNMVYSVFVNAVVATKHPGFDEELEWRIVCMPSLMPPSEYIQMSLELVGGIPQNVMKLPLGAEVEGSEKGFHIPSLFQRLIIGPTQESAALRDIFVAELREAGVPDAESRVVCSGIPIRT